MYRNRLLFCLLTLLCGLTVFAQLDAVQELNEVYLTDVKVVEFSKGYKLEKINDTVVKRNSVSLTDALRFNSLIYFKENGFGMVSSPSFRGTNAAQTAVIWNGININSVFTGQTDFNVVSPLGYDEIIIRSGGGGVLVGSGAVGGSIHLNNHFSFDAIDETQIGFGYGSFDTFSGQVSTTQTWKNHYLNLGVDFVSSENDYDYVGKNRKNEHGDFVRVTAKMNQARRLKNGVLSWNSEYSYNDRNFSGSITAIGRDAYKDINTRNLLQLRQDIGKFKTTAKAAHLFEQYRYYPVSNKPTYQQGKANTLIGSVESETELMDQIKLHGKVEYTVVQGEGENVGEHMQKTLAAVLLLDHQLSSRFRYGVNLRQEFLNGFDNPLLFSADVKWLTTSNYAIRLNGSRNYRVPTFNDLYWNSGGNEDLNPETSYQIELGHELSLGDFKFDIATYYISSKDLLKWVPVTGTIWMPKNIAEAQNWGIEVKGVYEFQWSEHKFRLEGNYAYTNAEDLEKKKQLIYVPYHKIAGSLSYQHQSLSAYIQALHTGEAFTTTDNIDVVDAYTVFNLGMEYQLPTYSNITLGGRVKNVFNTYYENVAYRPMPSRNFQIFLNLNI